MPGIGEGFKSALVRRIFFDIRALRRDNNGCNDGNPCDHDGYTQENQNWQIFDEERLQNPTLCLPFREDLSWELNLGVTLPYLIGGGNHKGT